MAIIHLLYKVDENNLGKLKSKIEEFCNRMKCEEKSSIKKFIYRDSQNIIAYSVILTLTDTIEKEKLDEELRIFDWLGVNSNIIYC